MLRGVQALLDQGQDGGQITAQQGGGIQPGRFGQTLKIGKDKESGVSVDVLGGSSREQRGILGSLFIPVESAWPVPSSKVRGQCLLLCFRQRCKGLEVFMNQLSVQ